MWLGELITDRGVGNGMSLLIFTSIIAALPAAAVADPADQRRLVAFVVVIAGRHRGHHGLVVFVEQAQRRIPVQYAKRMVGRRMYGGTSTYIPLKVNMAGVIPVIFASSLLYLPGAARSASARPDTRRLGALDPDTTSPAATSRSTSRCTSLLIIFFTYFYVAITFNPDEVADNMKKYGGFIPGIRAGRPTAEYLDYVLTRITLPGSLYLGVIAVIPLFALGAGQRQPELPLRRHRAS